MKRIVKFQYLAIAFWLLIVLIFCPGCFHVSLLSLMSLLQVFFLSSSLGRGLGQDPSFFLLISYSSGCWPVLFQRSLLLMVSGQWMFKTFLEQLLMNLGGFPDCKSIMLHVLLQFWKNKKNLQDGHTVYAIVLIKIQMFVSTSEKVKMRYIQIIVGNEFNVGRKSFCFSVETR